MTSGAEAGMGVEIHAPLGTYQKLDSIHGIPDPDPREEVLGNAYTKRFVHIQRDIPNPPSPNSIAIELRLRTGRYTYTWYRLSMDSTEYGYLSAERQIVYPKKEEKITPPPYEEVMREIQIAARNQRRLKGRTPYPKSFDSPSGPN